MAPQREALKIEVLVRPRAWSLAPSSGSAAALARPSLTLAKRLRGTARELGRLATTVTTMLRFSISTRFVAMSFRGHSLRQTFNQTNKFSVDSPIWNPRECSRKADLVGGIEKQSADRCLSIFAATEKERHRDI